MIWFLNHVIELEYNNFELILRKDLIIQLKLRKIE